MEEMTRDDIASMVGNHGFGIVSLASNDRAYGIPLFYAYDGLAFYFQSRPGAKDAFIRATKQACLSIIDLESPDDWRSVQAVGEVHRVTREKEHLQATDALMKVPFPPEFGLIAEGRPRRSAKAMYIWALTPTHLVGRQSSTSLSQRERLRERFR